MKLPEVSLIADALLACIPRDRNCPHYSEESFRRKLKGQQAREINLPLTIGRMGAIELYRSEWIEITEAACLTPKQLDVVKMRMEGHTFEEIGRTFGHSKQGAQNIFYQGAKKLAKAWMDYPYRGLPNVYEEECKRGLKVRGCRRSRTE